MTTNQKLFSQCPEQTMHPQILINISTAATRRCVAVTFTFTEVAAWKVEVPPLQAQVWGVQAGPTQLYIDIKSYSKHIIFQEKFYWDKFMKLLLETDTSSWDRVADTNNILYFPPSCEDAARGLIIYTVRKSPAYLEMISKWRSSINILYLLCTSFL